MHLFINALAASSGSGPTYVRNIVPQIAAMPDVKATVLLRPQLRRLLGEYNNILFVEPTEVGSAGPRYLFEQRIIPDLLRSSKADVLLSAGNFALRKSPIPQILLSGNSLYISRDFFADLRARRKIALWLDTRVKALIARLSVKWADVTVAPTDAFATQLRQWAGGNVVAIHHGFDREMFFGDDTPLPSELEQKLANPEGALRLLFVSHYNYYRNFETLFRALPMLKSRLRGRRIQLVLTCRLRTEDNPGTFDAEPAAALVKKLGIGAEVLELGAVPYHQLHHVYRCCDMYVSAAYAESFAHPLVEAMASARPVIASDLPVHREVCSDAALYFSTFSPEEFSERVMEIVTDPALGVRMTERGLKRSGDFSWASHMRQLLSIAHSIT